MKQLILVMLLFGTLSATAQNTAAHKLFEKYEDKKGFTSVLISEYAFQLIADVTEGEKEAFDDAAKMITGLRIITSESSPQTAAFVKDLKSTFKLSSSNYKPLMTVKDDGEEVLFYLREQGKKITEFVLLVQSEDSPVMILIEGNDIDLKKLKNIANNTDIDMLNELENLDN